MNYSSVETSCGQLWFAYQGKAVRLSRLGGTEADFLALCRLKLGAEPAPAADPATIERVRARLVADGELDFALDQATDFQRDVLRAVAAIPRGQVRTYAEVAASVGRPRAARAVGEVMRTNPIPLLIPCHRVVRSGGAIGNYSPDPAIKHRLLVEEGSIAG